MFARKRARTAKGRYKGDDKSTPFFNEAWIAKPAPWIVKKWRKFTKWYFNQWI